MLFYVDGVEFQLYSVIACPTSGAELGATYLFGGGCCGDAMVATDKGKVRRSWQDKRFVAAFSFIFEIISLRCLI